MLAKVTKMLPTAASELTPTRDSRSRGVTKMPKNDPKAELKMAAASLPPTARVRITAEDTGGGMQAITCSLQQAQPACKGVPERGLTRRGQTKRAGFLEGRTSSRVDNSARPSSPFHQRLYKEVHPLNSLQQARHCKRHDHQREALHAGVQLVLHYGGLQLLRNAGERAGSGEEEPAVDVERACSVMHGPQKNGDPTSALAKTLIQRSLHSSPLTSTSNHY